MIPTAHLALLSLDRIWVRPPEILRQIESHQIVPARIASDHLPFVAQINLALGGADRSS